MFSRTRKKRKKVNINKQIIFLIIVFIAIIILFFLINFIYNKHKTINEQIKKLHNAPMLLKS